MTITMNGKKISQKKAEEIIGKEKLGRRIAEAKQGHMDDPYEIQSWMDGMEITFC